MTELNIVTPRLLIRQFKPEDYEDLYEYLSDEQVVKYEPYHPFTREQCRLEAVKRSKNIDFLAVCLKDRGKLIGNIYFEKQDFGTWELGYVFNRSYQGSGYATESARAVLDYGFKEMMARRVVASCNPENTASWRLLERLHMRREGHQLKNIYFKLDNDGNPIWVDSYNYAILTEEWQQAVKA
jgi:RimJ/RimL family protein N-acetyltransferase